MSWSNLVSEQNSNAHLMQVFSHPDVLTLETGTEVPVFNAGFILYDSKTLQKLINVPVNFNSSTSNTNSQGSVIFSVKAGTFDYSINKLLYAPLSGNITISSDTIISIYLIKTQADVKFKIVEGASPVNNAVVKLNSDSILSNSLGIALFKALPLESSLNYSVKKDGYYEISGSFLLNTDTTINLEMVKNTTGIESGNNSELIRIYPNPASDILHFSIPGTFMSNTLIVQNITGRNVFSGIINEPEFTISLKEYPRGVYIIRIISGEDLCSRLFIKN